MDKKCLACGQVKPLTLEYYESNGRRRSGEQRFKPRCKGCPGKAAVPYPVGARVDVGGVEYVAVPPDGEWWLGSEIGTPYFEGDRLRFPAEPEQESRVDAQQKPRVPNYFPSVKEFDLSDTLPRIEVVDEKLTRVEEHRLKVKNAELAAQVKALTAELSDAQLMRDVVEAAQAVPVDPIVPRERASGVREGTAQVLASDWHIEEEVLPEQVAGRNRYNLDISRKRMTRFFEATRWGLDFNRQAFKIRDLILWLGGDFITNYLHPDNVETNLLSPPEALAYALSSIVTGIRHLLEDTELERIVVTCNDGNHGRMTEKMRSANRTAMSLETMLYGMIAREFSSEPRVKFIIAGGSHLYYEVYGRTIRYTHGDETKYGGGVGGITIPIYRSMSRWDTVRHADLTIIGHYHQRTSLTDLIINGCFVEGTRVITPEGPRAIETIVIGDRVISGDGSIQIVENTTSQTTDELVRFRVKGLPNFIECTRNHQIRAIKGESSNEHRFSRMSPRAQTTILNEKPQWLRAEHLSEGDWVHTPALAGTREDDVDVLWVNGLFLAEGHTIVEGGADNNQFRIEFTMHIDELHVLERAKTILDKHLGRSGEPGQGRQNTEGRIWTRPDRTTSQLAYSGESVARAYREQFGHFVVGKKVPAWMFELAPRQRQAVVQGWFDGDGHAGKCVTSATVSENLAWGMCVMAIGTEFEPLLYKEGVQKIRKDVYGTAYRISFVKGQDVRWIDGERYLRIDHRRRVTRTARVLDLQVSGAHTYCVEGVEVHNSLIGYSPYSLSIGARFEPPAQDFTMLDPRRFKGLSMPLWVSERVDDEDANQEGQ